jgi:exodeoxyribonuclease VII large subunit
VEERVERLSLRVLRAGRYELLRAKQQFWNVGIDSALRQVRDALRRREQRMDELGFRADTAIKSTLQTQHARLARLEVRLQRQNISARMAADHQCLATLQIRLRNAGRSLTLPQRKKVDHCTAQLDVLSPLKVLERGYALVYGPNGKLLRSSTEVLQGDTITARLAEGSLTAAVTNSSDR